MQRGQQYAVNLKVGQRVRPVSPQGGWHWADVTAVKPHGAFVKIEAQWASGGSHSWLVNKDQRFRVIGG